MGLSIQDQSEKLEDNYSYFIEKAIGITVVHLIASYNENNKIQLNPSMDYHLHYLLYYDRDLNHIGVLCLDTNDLQTIAYANGNDMRYMFKTLVMEMTQFFVDKMDSMINVNCFDEKILFDRAEQKLWDKFNEIKQQTFISKLSQFAGAILQEKEPEIKKEPTPYKGSKIFLTEERFVPQYENSSYSS